MSESRRGSPSVPASTPRAEAVTQILEAAIEILIGEGIRALTLRRIATACALRVGNVTYYFATKDELIKAVLDVVVAGYSEAIGDLRRRTGETAETRLVLLIRMLLEDIQSQATTNLFPELWALANHDPFVAACVDDIYGRARLLMCDLIGEINPALDADEREAVAVVIQAATEGMTIFAGHRKAMTDRMPWIEAVLIKAIVGLVAGIDSATIRAELRRPLWA